MEISKNAGEGVSATVGVGKDLVALLRDAFLMVFALLLIFWPHTFNDILVNAGFEEGSLAGFKWKSGFAEARAKLEQAEETLKTLKETNANLTVQLAEAKKFVNDDALKAKITSAEQSSEIVAERSAAVQSSVQATIAQTAQLANRLPTQLQPVWAVVFGTDTKLDEAKFEIKKAASVAGLQNAKIFYRDGRYLSVAVAADRAGADELFAKAKNYRQGAYRINLNSWCPKQVETADYVACS